LFLAMVMALALALGPLAMPSGQAMAAAPAAHHAAMASAGHCDEQGQPDRRDHPAKAAKTCCVGCIAVANLPAPPAEPAAMPRLRERPAPDRFRLGYLGEIATPPPRVA
jgi:hypothetical protein